MRSESQPGNIRYQIGRTLNLIDEATMRADLPRVRDGVRLLRAKTAVYLKRAERLEDYAAIKAADDSWSAEFEACMARTELILEVLSEWNLYGYREETTGDGSALLEVDV